MQEFIAKYREEIQGRLSGFDRLVIGGTLRRLDVCQYRPEMKALRAIAMEQYCLSNQIWLKDFAAHVKSVSERIKRASTQPFRDRDLPVIYLPSPKIDKNQIARQVARERKIAEGLVCAISATELHPTFQHRNTFLIRREAPCHVLYHYLIHPQLGWMYARLQTWFPFQIQVGLNGREWLAQQMQRAGIQFQQAGNCFLWVEDYVRAQALLDEQLQTDWVKLLHGLADQLNPLRESIFEKYPAAYYWTCRESEWASDIGFRKAESLLRLMPMLVRHSTVDMQSANVLRYFGRKVNRSGEVPRSFRDTLQSDLKRREEGDRVKFWMNGNSAKFYDKAYSDIGSVFRVETTLNNVKGFKAYRPKEGGPEDELSWRHLRTGVADLHRRGQVSQATNERLLDALARTDDSRTVEELTAAIQQPTQWKQRRVRALQPWGQDHDLLQAVYRGDFLIQGLRNRDLQAILYDHPAASRMEARRRSAAISRKLRMLRAHGLIQKVPKTHRYQITSGGRTVLMTILTTAKTSLHELNQLHQRTAA
jgi:hypothetical protein